MTNLQVSFSRKPRAHPARSGSSSIFFIPLKLRPLHQAEYAVLKGEQVAAEILNFVGSN